MKKRWNRPKYLRKYRGNALRLKNACGNVPGTYWSPPKAVFAIFPQAFFAFISASGHFGHPFGHPKMQRKYRENASDQSDPKKGPPSHI